MATHSVRVNLTVEIANPSTFASVASLAGAEAKDERSQIQAAVNRGLKELYSVGDRYGIRLVEGEATVD